MSSKSVLIGILIFWIATAHYTPTEKVRILLAGDSTISQKPATDQPERGWGMLLPDMMAATAEVHNFALNGRSTKSFVAEGHWAKLLAHTRKGDFVLIQFGHNDSKTNDTTRYAAPQSTYPTNLTRMAREVQQKGATPVLITPVARRKFVNGQYVDEHGDYPAAVRQVAQKLNIALIDLHKESTAYLQQIGPEASKRLFLHIPEGHYANYKGKAEDNTHFSEYGATLVAAMVCRQIAATLPDLRKHLRLSNHAGKYAYELPTVYVPHFKKDTLSIATQGAVANGLTLNTRAIQATIDTLHARGGGVVMVPSGLWISGPIVLKSNINLYLAPNATLQFTSDFDQYPIIEGNWEGEPSAVMQPPIWAVQAENIAITGKGIIDGNGDRMRHVKKEKLTESQWKAKLASGGVLDEKKRMWYPTEKALLGSTLEKPWLLQPGKKLSDFEYIRDFLRPNLVVLNGCKNILLQGVTFQNSAAWCLHPLMSEHLTVLDVMVKNPWYAQNGDGIDVESCSHVRIENSIFDVGDDALCMKSGRDAAGRKRAMPTQDVVIKNCVVYHAHGGFVIGSEMSGGAENIYVSHCTFLGTDIGLRFKTTRGRGGVVKNIFIDHISMRDIPGEAILFDMYYAAKDPIPLPGEERAIPTVEMKPVDETTPVFKDFSINNVYIAGAKKGIFIRGVPEMPVQNIVLNNMIIQSNIGIDCQEAQQITFSNIQLISKAQNPVVDILNSRQLRFDKLEYVKGAANLFRVSGDRCADITVKNTNTTQSTQPVSVSHGATLKNITIQP